jgi:MFS transporter, PAT family, beta-lactamase induction signal transducer AmpG
VLVCASIVLVTAACAFALRDHSHGDGAASQGRLEAGALVKHMLGERAWRVIVLALTYKLGLHMASFLIKPMVVDAKWTDREIGLAVIGAGTTAGLLGAVFGGALHRIIDERRALVTGVVLQSLVCLPLFFVLTLGAPKGWTTTAIVAENLASGVGTTVLFAALMTATRRNDAGMHYTLLTTGNNVAIFAGTTLSGVLADHVGKGPVLVLAAVVCLLPLALLARWNEAARASADVELPA